jgi:hypothetical protein
VLNFMALHIVNCVIPTTNIVDLITKHYHHKHAEHKTQ